MYRVFICLFLLCGPLAAFVHAAADDRPNIVVILADDLGWGDAGCYNSKTRTSMPSLDRIAAEGVRLTDAHSPSAVCTPTRYGLLTGRYCWRSRLKRGVLGGRSPALIEPNRLTLPRMLKGQGYKTACIGKWHLGLGDGNKTYYDQPLRPGPLEAGFDYFFGIPASLDMVPYCYVENDRPTETISGKVDGSKHRRQNGGGFWRGGEASPSFRHIDVLPRITDAAIQWIDDRAVERNTDGTSSSQAVPFFLYFPLSAPHTPWLPTEEFQGKSGAGHYGDFVMQVDAVIGRILATLDRHKLTNNTLIIVTSDNGSHWPVKDIEKWNHRANGPWRGQKADIHEGGHRVPFVARWPGHIPPNTTSDETACLTDLTATIAAITGATLPENAAEDSYDLSPALFGQTTSGSIREATVHHSVSGMFSIRQGDWKLILGRGSGGFTRPRKIEPKSGEPTGQLYNLATDPAEQNNIHADHPAVVARLTALLERYRASGRSR